MTERRVRMSGKLVTKGEAEEYRFLRFVEKSDGCWTWRGSGQRAGYGVFWLRGKLLGAHRASHVLFIGPVADGMDVCHHCDNPRCVNPDHLFVGTPRDNWNDMHRKGRGSPPPLIRGSAHPKAKLSEGLIPEVFRLRSLGLTTYQIAEVFGISRPAICAVLNRKTWRHIHVAHHQR